MDRFYDGEKVVYWRHMLNSGIDCHNGVLIALAVKHLRGLLRVHPEALDALADVERAPHTDMERSYKALAKFEAELSKVLTTELVLPIETVQLAQVSA